MASQQLTILVQVVDQNAAKKLKDLEDKVNKVGGAAKKSGIDLKEFNKSLFSILAVTGLVSRSLHSLTDSMLDAARLDRVTRQFESLFGDRGRFLDLVSTFTDTTVDRFEAMKQGIILRNEGVIKSTNQWASIVAKASVVAQKAGLDSTEGIKEYSAFLQDLSLGHLEKLGLINRTNASLLAQIEILKGSAGALGGVVTNQRKLEIGMMLLNNSTKEGTFGLQDNLSNLTKFTLGLKDLSVSIGNLLAEGLGPFIGKLGDLAESLSKTLNNIREHHKDLTKWIGGIFAATGAVTGLVLALGTLKASFGMLKILGALAGIGSAGRIGGLLGGILPIAAKGAGASGAGAAAGSVALAGASIAMKYALPIAGATYEVLTDIRQILKGSESGDKKEQTKGMDALKSGIGVGLIAGILTANPLIGVAAGTAASYATKQIENYFDNKSGKTQAIVPKGQEDIEGDVGALTRKMNQTKGAEQDIIKNEIIGAVIKAQLHGEKQISKEDWERIYYRGAKRALIETKDEDTKNAYAGDRRALSPGSSWGTP